MLIVFPYVIPIHSEYTPHPEGYYSISCYCLAFILVDHIIATVLIHQMGVELLFELGLFPEELLEVETMSVLDNKIKKSVQEVVHHTCRDCLSPTCCQGRSTKLLRWHG